MIILKKEVYECCSDKLERRVEKKHNIIIDTRDIATVIEYQLNLPHIIIGLKTYYILNTGEKLSRKEYLKMKRG